MPNSLTVDAASFHATAVEMLSRGVVGPDMDPRLLAAIAEIKAMPHNTRQALISRGRRRSRTLTPLAYLHGSDCFESRAVTPNQRKAARRKGTRRKTH